MTKLEQALQLLQDVNNYGIRSQMGGNWCNRLDALLIDIENASDAETYPQFEHFKDIDEAVEVFMVEVYMFAVSYNSDPTRNPRRYEVELAKMKQLVKDALSGTGNFREQA